MHTDQLNVAGSDQASSLGLLGPRTALRAVGLARLEPLQDALGVEHVAARDGRELVRSREELEAGCAADPHDDDYLTRMIGLKKEKAVVEFQFFFLNMLMYFPRVISFRSSIPSS